MGDYGLWGDGHEEMAGGWEDCMVRGWGGRYHDGAAESTPGGRGV